MKDSLNCAHVIITLVRTFFDGFAKGVADTHEIDFSSKQEVKKVMLNHYESISKSYGQVMFSILSVITHQHFSEVELKLQKLSSSDKNDVAQLFQVACNDVRLYNVMVDAYKQNFSLLLEGRVSTIQEHIDYHTSATTLELPTVVGEEIVLRLLVRTAVQSYMAGVKIAQTNVTTIKQAPILALLITNVNLLINHAPLDDSRLAKASDIYDYFLMLCGTSEYCNIIFSEMENEMQRLMNE